MQQAQTGMAPALTSDATHFEQHMQRRWHHACQGSVFLTGMPRAMLKASPLLSQCRQTWWWQGAGRGRRQGYRGRACCTEM